MNTVSSDHPIIVPVLLGPTAVGKTAYALKLAMEMDWEIISCDSRQIYRKMDIGTAKPTGSELAKVKHWVIDIIDPSEPYSAYHFACEAQKIIRDLHSRNRTAFICGGTGLYFQSLSEGLGPQQESDPDLRLELMKRGEAEGSAVLHEELEKKILRLL